MTTRNAVTGDAIKTKVTYGESLTNFERGWEALQRGNEEQLELEFEEVKPLPDADEREFLLWMAQVAYGRTKAYTGTWEYLIDQYEKETETTPSEALLSLVTQGD